MAGPRLLNLASARLDELRATFEKFFPEALPVQIPADAVGFELDWAGIFEALVRPAAGPELIRTALHAFRDPLDGGMSWQQLPDPFFAIAYAEGSNIGYFWLAMRDAGRFFYFRDMYFHTYDRGTSFASCHRRLADAVAEFRSTAPRPGDYLHHLDERWGDLAG